MEPSTFSSQLKVIKPPDSALGSRLHVADLPALQIGMVGFSQLQRVQIEGIVKLLPNKTAAWCVGRFSDAHAWLVCSDKVRMASAAANVSPENLLVLPGLPSEKATVLNLPEITRPLAFSLPSNNPDIEPRLTFDAASPNSLSALLEQFERCLWRRLAQFVLGKQLIEREPELQPKVYHVQYRGTLLAVMDFVSFRIGMLPDANPKHFERAIWEKRPVQAADIPHHFVLTDVARLRWVYAQHSERNVLPSRYRHEVIYFRRSPQVELSWVTDSQLRILNQLCSRPSTFQQLVERLGMRHENLTHDLSCLYFATSLTTTESKAANVSRRGPNTTMSVPPAVATRRAPHIFDSSLPHSSSPADSHESTAPVQLAAQ